VGSLFGTAAFASTRAPHMSKAPTAKSATMNKSAKAIPPSLAKKFGKTSGKRKMVKVRKSGRKQKLAHTKRSKLPNSTRPGRRQV